MTALNDMETRLDGYITVTNSWILTLRDSKWAVALRNDWHGRTLLSALRTMPQVDLGTGAGSGTHAPLVEA